MQAQNRLTSKQSSRPYWKKNPATSEKLVEHIVGFYWVSFSESKACHGHGWSSRGGTTRRARPRHRSYLDGYWDFYSMDQRCDCMVCLRPRVGRESAFFVGPIHDAVEVSGCQQRGHPEDLFADSTDLRAVQVKWWLRKKIFSVGDELEWITAPQGVQEEQMAEAYMYGQKILRFAFMSGSINFCRPFDRVSEIFALHVIGLLPMQRTKQKRKTKSVRKGRRRKRKRWKRTRKRRRTKSQRKTRKKRKPQRTKRRSKTKRETCCRFKHIGWSLLDIWSRTGGCASARNHTGCIARRVGTFGPDEHFETHKKRTKVSFKNKSSLQWAEMYIDAKNQLVINQFHLSLRIPVNIYIDIYIYIQIRVIVSLQIFIYVYLYIHIKRYLAILLYINFMCKFMYIHTNLSLCTFSIYMYIFYLYFSPTYEEIFVCV